MIWHSSDAADVIKELGVDPKMGLSSQEVAQRIKIYGENRSRISGSRIFSKEISKRLLRPNVLILFALSAVLIITDAIAKKPLWISPISILFILVANALLGAWSAIRNQKLIKELGGKISVFAKVLREGAVSSADSAQLVPGDIVFLEAGDFIPADGRLLEENSLICDESAVTGDSAPVEKGTEAHFEDICPLSERKNMVYSGCLVTYGHAVMVVTDTGNNTEIGKLKQIKEQTVGFETPSKKYLKQLGKSLNIVLLVSAAVLFVLGVLTAKTTQSFSDLVLNMLILAVSIYSVSIDKALPRFVNSAMSFSLKNMAEKNAILKNTEKIETLSKVSVIISDKTGTLTRNNMKMTSMFDGNEVVDLYTDSPSENGVAIIRMAALCCNANVSVGANGKPKGVGDPTEVGIVSAYQKYQGSTKEELENMYPRMAEVPFDSNRKLMTTVNMINNRPFAIVRGAPENLLSCCTEGNIKGAVEAAAKMGQTGERIIGVAIKPLDEVPSNPTPENMECNLIFLGLLGMTDSLSHSTREALSESVSAGIRVIMVTGDQITTATTIARELGILGEGEIAITGEELSDMSDDELSDKVKSISVYCGINDSDKVRIVRAWQQAGEIVAVTGDSVEDAEAIKLADIGCAMGVTGKDIVKGCADLVATDDSFIAILKSIKTARNHFYNLRHGAQLFFAALIGEIIALLLGFLIFGQAVITAASVLLVNTVLLLALSRALANEPDRKNSMLLPPRNKKEKLFSSVQDLDFIWQGVIIAALTLISYGANIKVAPLGAAFATFAILLIFLTFSLRICSSLYHEGVRVGKSMLIGIAFTFVILMLVLATPLCHLFGISKVLAGNIFAAIGFGALIFIICEVVKGLRKVLKDSKQEEV